MIRVFSGFFAVFAFVLANHSHAADFHSSRAASLGGAGHAGPALNDAIFLNPSYISFMKSYSIGAAYQWFSGGGNLPDGSSELHGRNLHASIQDGRSELFQAGVAYTQRPDGTLLSLAASKGLGQHWSVGLGGKFFFPNDGSKKIVRDANLSATFIPLSWLQLSAMVDNLITSEDSRSRGFHREIILGTKVNIQRIVLLYFDPHFVPSISEDYAFGHEAGAEFAPFKDIFLRIGNFRNATLPLQAGTRGDGFGWGAGWIAPRFSIDYGMSRVLKPTQMTVHQVGMTLYL